MKEIPLTQGKVAIVDDEYYERLNQFKWYALKRPNTWYAVRNIYVENKRTAISMHREIMDASKGQEIDHKNGDGLYNLKVNLRFCTCQQNQFNQVFARSDNKFGIKGVCYHDKAKKFQAAIRINGKRIHLGIFTVLTDAEQAYRVAEIKYFGEFAREETKKLYLVV